MNETIRNGWHVLVAVLALGMLCLTGAAAAEATDAGTTAIGNPMTAGTLPSSYDLRDYGYVTPVRDQSPFGTCWAHGTIGAIESSILVKGLVAPEDADALDLSEVQMIYFMTNRDGVTKGTALPGYEDTLDSYEIVPDLRIFCEKGYAAKAPIYQLAAGFGVATEDDDDLKYANLVNLVDGRKLSPELAVSENAYYPKAMMAVDIDDRDAVKEHLMKYGAAALPYYVDQTFRSTYTGYVDENGEIVLTHLCVLDNIYQDTNTISNHIVTLIGWDDTYPKENFPGFKRLEDDTLVEIPVPEHDGAWLIKNSWGNTIPYRDPDGTEKTWDGYAWISYEDTSVGKYTLQEYYNSLVGYRGVVFFDMAPAYGFYDNIYQYDAGLYSDLNMEWGLNDGYLANLMANEIGDRQTIAVKNAYTADGPELVTAVGINTMNEDVEYLIRIIVNDVVMSTVSGSAPAEGYYAVGLPEPVLVHAGDTIEIPVEFSRIKTGNEDLGALVDIATNKSFSHMTGFVTPTGIPGRSYVKYEYETRDFTDTDTAELFRIFTIDIDELMKLAVSDEVRLSLTPEQLDAVNESVKQEILAMIDERNELQELADEDGWIDIADLPTYTRKGSAFTYGSARIKMFTVDVEEQTVTGNMVQLADDDMVTTIAFDKVIPDATVGYVEKLPDLDLPAGNLDVLGTFRILADGAAPYRNTAVVAFRADAEDPDLVTLMHRNAFGTWIDLPTVHAGNGIYLGVTTTLSPMAVVEYDTAEDRDLHRLPFLFATPAASV